MNRYARYLYLLRLVRQSMKRNNRNLLKTPLTIPFTPLTSSQSDTYCSACCDNSQVDLHTAKAILLNCMDFRLRDNVTCHLNLKGYKNAYDDVIAAGASLGYNGLANYSSWDTFIDSHISLAYDLHEISQILIIEHENCGAYKKQYGSNITLEEEDKYHSDNVKACAEKLWSKFNPIDGSIKKIEHLTIIGYLIAIDGCSLTELYRKQ